MRSVGLRPAASGGAGCRVPRAVVRCGVSGLVGRCSVWITTAASSCATHDDSCSTAVVTKVRVSPPSHTGRSTSAVAPAAFIGATLSAGVSGGILFTAAHELVSCLPALSSAGPWCAGQWADLGPSG